MDILSDIIDAVSAVAPTIANIVVPGSGPAVHALMREVTGDPPGTPIDEVARKIDADPELLLKLKQVAANRETRLAKIAAGNLATVNKTMQGEAESEHWPQYSWRPFNGFLYGITVFCVYFILPLCKIPAPAVPQWIWIGWGAILGVTTWHRGRQKRAATRETGMIAGLVKAVRGK